MESKDLFGGEYSGISYTLEVESSGLQLPGPIIPLVCKPLSGTIVRVGIKFWDIPNWYWYQIPKKPFIPAS